MEREIKNETLTLVTFQTRTTSVAACLSFRHGADHTLDLLTQTLVSVIEFLALKELAGK